MQLAEVAKLQLLQFLCNALSSPFFVRVKATEGTSKENGFYSTGELTCVSALRTLILWVEINRSTSVRVWASPSAFCRKKRKEFSF